MALPGQREVRLSASTKPGSTVVVLITGGGVLPAVVIGRAVAMRRAQPDKSPLVNAQRSVQSRA